MAGVESKAEEEARSEEAEEMVLGFSSHALGFSEWIASLRA